MQIPKLHVASRHALTETGNHRSYTSYCHTLHLFDYSVRLTAGGRSYDLGVGDAALVVAGTNVLYDAPDPSYHFVFHFDLDTPDEPDLINGFEVFRLAHAYSDVLQECLSIQHDFESDNPWHQRSASLGLYRLLYRLHGLSAQEPSGIGKADRALIKAAEWIDTNLHLPVRVEDLAYDVGLDHNYLARKFKEKYGKSIQEFIRDQRLSRARQWLIHTDLPIKVIAMDLGFYDTQHFYRCFKARYAMPPGKLRHKGR